MVFRIATPYSEISKNLRVLCKNFARRRLLLYKMNATDKQLDKYLQKNYNFELKQACLFLIKNSWFNSNNVSEIIITFKDPKYDKLASLITYGNSEIKGSKILQVAFNQ